MPTFDKDEKLKTQRFILGLGTRLGTAINLHDPMIVQRNFDLPKREELNQSSRRAGSKLFRVAKAQHKKDDKKKSPRQLRWFENQKRKQNDDKKGQNHQSKLGKKSIHEVEPNKYAKRNRPNPVENSDDHKGSSISKPIFSKNGCFHYGGKHYSSQCPNKEDYKGDYLTIRENHCINTATNKQERDNQATSIALEVKIFNKIVSILIDFGATKSFISSYLLHKIPAKPINMHHPWNLKFASRQ